MVFFPEWALATIIAMVVASVPFLQKIAQSAWLTWATKASARSTITGAGPVMVSPCSMRPT